MLNQKRGLKFFIIILVFVITIFTFDISVLRRESYALSSSSNLEISNYIPANRGKFLDRNGQVLAENKIVLEFSSQEIQDLSGFRTELLRLYSSNSELTFSEVSSLEDESGFQIEIKNNQLLYEVRELSKSFQAIESKIKTTRIYNYPYQTAHIIGYLGLASQEDIDSGYKINDWIGKVGFENKFDNSLRGTDGIISNANGANILLQPVDGNDIKLNLDINWQNNIYNLLDRYNNIYGAAGGAGVVINTNTSEVMALVSYPGYDINAFMDGITTDEFNNITQQRTEPLIDKAIGSSYAPGSVFKVLSSQILSELNYINKNSYYYSNRCLKIGEADFCEFGRNFYGWMDLNRAIYTSSNMFFCNYILEAHNDGRVGEILDMAGEIFGVEEKTGIELDSEVAGSTGDSIYPDEWFQGESCNFVIGQGRVQVTPLRMANIVGELINGSKIQPTILKKDTSIQNNTSDQTTGITVETRDAILRGMESVSRDQGSSVYRFFRNIPNWLIAKTGSAESFENINGYFVDRTHSWIIGAFEYKGEKYSYAFFLRYGGGGFYLAPIVADFINYINSI